MVEEGGRKRRRGGYVEREEEGGGRAREKQAANADDGSEKLAQCHPFSGSAKADWRAFSRVSG